MLEGAAAMKLGERANGILSCRLIRIVSPILTFPAWKSIVLKRENLKSG